MKKKLLIASDCFLPRWDGIARFLTELIPYLCEEYTTTVIAPDFPDSPRSHKGARVIRIKTYPFQVGDYSPPRIKAALIREEILNHDIVFSQTIGPIGAVATILAKRHNKKVASYVHSLEWELFANSITQNNTIRKSVRTITKTFVRRVYSNTDLLVLPSNHVKGLMKDLGINVKSAIVKLGVDTEAFCPAESKEMAKKKIYAPNKPIIGYAGRIGREKDVPTLLRAYQLVRKTVDCELMIVGSGIGIYDSEMKKIGVIRHGSTNNIVDYLQAMDVYVLPSLTETSSLSTMEAMACGIPVFVTGAGETGRYIKEGKNGFKFKQRDDAMLAKKLIRALGELDSLARIGAQARKTIVDGYSWDATASKMLSALSRL